MSDVRGLEDPAVDKTRGPVKFALVGPMAKPGYTLAPPPKGLTMTHTPLTSAAANEQTDIPREPVHRQAKCNERHQTSRLRCFPGSSASG